MSKKKKKVHKCWVFMVDAQYDTEYDEWCEHWSYKIKLHKKLKSVRPKKVFTCEKKAKKHALKIAEKLGLEIVFVDGIDYLKD